MLVVISYDIQNDRKRTRLAKRLRDFGPRVQKSVFEADVKEDELIKLKTVLDQVSMKEDESIRLYQVCAECARKINIWGGGKVTEDEDYYII